MRSPISARVRPVSRSSLMRDAHVFIERNLRYSVSARQRLPVTAFRSNWGVDTIGTRIRKKREARHMSRRALGQAVGLASSTIADLENGYQKSTTKLHKIAEALGTTIEHLEDAAPDAPRQAPHSLSERESALLTAFRLASPDGKRALEAAASALASPFPPPPTGITRHKRPRL